MLRRSLESQYWVKLIAGSIILYGLYWYNSPYQRCDNLGKKLEASNRALFVAANNVPAHHSAHVW